MIEIKVCIGSACHLKGSYNVIQSFLQMIEEYGLHDRIELKSTFCMKQCQYSGVGVTIDDTTYRIAPEAARTFFKESVLTRV